MVVRPPNSKTIRNLPFHVATSTTAPKGPVIHPLTPSFAIFTRAWNWRRWQPWQRWQPHGCSVLSLARATQPLDLGEVSPSISKKISSCCTERANPQVTSNTSNRQRCSRYLQVSLDPFKRWTMNFPAPAALPPLNPAAAFRSSPWCPQRRSGVGELKCPSGSPILNMYEYLWISIWIIYIYIYEYIYWNR